jgi:hypothetical protein
MSVYVYNGDKRLNNRITPVRLQRLWARGYICVVYDRLTNRIICKAKQVKCAVTAQLRNPHYGIIMLCDQHIKIQPPISGKEFFYSMSKPKKLYNKEHC